MRTGNRDELLRRLACALFVRTITGLFSLGFLSLAGFFAFSLISHDAPAFYLTADGATIRSPRRHAARLRRGWSMQPRRMM